VREAFGDEVKDIVVPEKVGSMGIPEANGRFLFMEACNARWRCLEGSE